MNKNNSQMNQKLLELSNQIPEVQEVYKKYSGFYQLFKSHLRTTAAELRFGQTLCNMIYWLYSKEPGSKYTKILNDIKHAFYGPECDDCFYTEQIVTLNRFCKILYGENAKEQAAAILKEISGPSVQHVFENAVVTTTVLDMASVLNNSIAKGHDIIFEDDKLYIQVDRNAEQDDINEILHCPEFIILTHTGTTTAIYRATTATGVPCAGPEGILTLEFPCNLCEYAPVAKRPF